MTAQSAQLQLENFSDEPSVLTIKAAYDIAGQLGSGKFVTRKDINAADGWSVKMSGCAVRRQII